MDVQHLFGGVKYFVNGNITHTSKMPERAFFTAVQSARAARKAFYLHNFITFTVREKAELFCGRAEYSQSRHSESGGYVHGAGIIGYKKLKVFHKGHKFRQSRFGGKVYRMSLGNTADLFA